MSIRHASATLVALFFSTLTQAQTTDFSRIGTYDFPTTTASAEAQEAFLAGVGYLHSFGMTQAQEAFRAAQQYDPDFVMAYWGEAFTYQHPFFWRLERRPGPGVDETRFDSCAACSQSTER